MESSVLLRQLLRSPSASLHLLNAPFQPRFRNLSLFSSALSSSSRITHHCLISTESLPRVAQPSIWQSIIPKFLRTPRDPNAPAKPKSKEWNPATPFIVLALLIGSQAIQTLSLKRDMANFNRKAEAKMGLLREVIERVQKGEDVDIERILGTGDPEKEKEWEEVLEEIEEDDILFQSRKRRRANREAAKEAEAQGNAAAEAEKAKIEAVRLGNAKFY